MKIHRVGGIQGKLFCFKIASFYWLTFRDCYSVNLNLAMGSSLPRIRYPNLERYPEEFEIAEASMMIRPIRAK